ncbi:peptidylprolyl isomerase [Bradyrhizobium rifense]|uniref:Peptidylprolyl isomerase n=1 Tax=Bradyrhizobium rifense TaxID=515499 RepID=A0A5D3KVA5_9BRAD|nr:peptidylprolyl isomerase [Bradyrhizobium rifense]
MLRRCVLVICLAVLGLALNGCTRCGPIWDDWLHEPKSCRSDRL